MRIVIRSTDGDDVRETKCQRRTCVEKNRGSRRRWKSRVAVNVSVRKGGVSSALRELLRAHADLDRICVLVVEAHVERCSAAFASKDTRHWPRRIRACGRGKESESKKASDGSHCCEVVTHRRAQELLNMITLSLPSHIVPFTLARCCALFQPLSSPHSLGSFSPASPLNVPEAACVSETSSTRRNGQMGRFCKVCRKRNTSSFSFGDI